MRTVLISGAGVAGPALAYWLARAGFRPTVVERAQGRRSSGSPVDVRGPATAVVEAMGIVDRLKAARTHATHLRFAGIERRYPMAADGIEIARADLAGILHDAARPDAEFRFGDTITSLRQDPGGVDVTFERAEPQRFDLVVGADGLHSATRARVFGEEPDYVRPTGLYVATTPLGEPAEDPHDIVLHNSPGRLVSVHPARGQALVAFVFRRHPIPGFDHRDAGQHRRVLREAYGGDRGWRVPELLRRAEEAGDLYFDAVAKVVIPSWSRGRVVLLGDAAASISLLGDGSSMAVRGAKVLADALAGEKDHAAAFARYESIHRRRADALRRAARLGALFLVPRTGPGIAVRNRLGGVVMAR